MKRIRKSIMAVLVLVLALTAAPCQSAWASSVALARASILSANIKDADKNINWDESATQINLAENVTTVSGSGAAISGNVVTITQKGDYVISGTLSDGQIAIVATSSEKVHIILNGANITNKTGAAIYASQCDKLIVTLAQGTQNTLTDGGENFVYADLEKEEPNAALFSKDDLTINGTGGLTVNAGFNNGIGTKDDLLIVSGNINVTAANHGLRGNDSVTVAGGTLNITAGNDGIQTNNSEDAEKGFILIEDGTLNITAANDGIQAETILSVKSGVFNIVTGGGSEAATIKQSDSMPGMRQNARFAGEMPPNQENHAFLGIQDRFNNQPTDIQRSKGMKSEQPNVTNEQALNTITTTQTSESCKGLKAVTEILITGGEFEINSADDSIHSNDSIAISGGSFGLASGDDAVHADGDLTLTGNPVINITSSYEGLEANTMTIADGTISIVASDDGINVSGGNNSNDINRFGADSFKTTSSRWLKITGGTITIVAEQDINGSGEMTGGVLNITAATSGEGDTIDSDSTFLYYFQFKRSQTRERKHVASGVFRVNFWRLFKWK